MDMNNSSVLINYVNQIAETEIDKTLLFLNRLLKYLLLTFEKFATQTDDKSTCR